MRNENIKLELLTGSDRSEYFRLADKNRENLRVFMDNSAASFLITMSIANTGLIDNESGSNNIFQTLHDNCCEIKKRKTDRDQL